MGHYTPKQDGVAERKTNIYVRLSWTILIGIEILHFYFQTEIYRNSEGVKSNSVGLQQQSRKTLMIPSYVSLDGRLLSVTIMGYQQFNFIVSAFFSYKLLDQTRLFNFFCKLHSLMTCQKTKVALPFWIFNCQIQ